MSGSYFIGGQNDINGVTISGVPSVGQVIEATSSTTATWQSPGSTITLGGDVTGPANANIVGRLNGGSSGLLSLSATDFIAMGGATCAAGGLIRTPYQFGLVLKERNSGNTGDNRIITTALGNYYFGSTDLPGGAVLWGNTVGMSLSTTVLSNPSVSCTGSTVTICGTTVNFQQTAGTTTLQYTAAGLGFGAIPAVAGLVRLSNAPGTIIAQRNSGNTADLVVVSSDTSGNSVFGAGAAASSSLNPTSATVFINCAGSGSGVMTLNSAAGTFNNTNGMQFSDSNGTVAIGFVPAHAGNAYIAFGPTLTSANIAHTTKPSTGATAGVNMIISAQPGQQQSSTNANNNGGNLILSSGAAGTGGSGAAGLTGNVNIVVDGYTQASFTPMGIQYAISTIPLNTSGTYFMEQNELACPNIVFTGTLAGAITIAFGGVVGEWSLDFSQLTYGVNAVTITNGAGTYTATTILGTKKLLTVVCNTTSTVACG